MPSMISPEGAEGRSQSRWLRAAILAFCALLVFGGAIYQWRMRGEVVGRGEADAAMLANSLAQHAMDTFEIADVLLTVLADDLRVRPDRSLDTLVELNLSLERQVRRVPRIRSLVAFDRLGRQFASSQAQVPDWFDLSTSPAFHFHSGEDGEALRIGAPQRSPSTQDWVVTVTRRWNDANGAFGGMVMATIRVDYFSRFYGDFDIDGMAGIVLLTGSGVMLANYPVFENKLGNDFSALPWFTETLAQPTGLTRFNSSVDGKERIYGFRRFDDIPLLMMAGISPTAVLAGWLPGCIVFMACTSVLAAGLAVVGWRMADKLDTRARSERRWSALAMTDALTGIRNRRAFDEIVRRAWRAGEDRGRPMALLLIDVDNFKSFNDTYGHPGGDACLRAIGDLLGKTLERPGDCAARYGGEEFALLLSETGPASALVAAEKIRQAVMHLNIAHAKSATLPVVTVSIGFATAEFDLASDETGSVDGLIDRADRALYRAKLEGRNRVRFEPAVSRTVEAA